MRLSTVVELLLILLLVAFAAYGRVIDSNLIATNRSIRANNIPKQSIQLPTLTETTENVNRYCTCSNDICNCCRNFHIPLVQLKGPGCASLQYLKDDNLAVQLSFGENILTSTIVNGKNPKPVCVPLPGGFSKFCGRIYSIKRDVNNHFKACLGLELQSATELEASMRVSCFRFGPEGLKLRPAEPLPIVETEQASEEDDDDDLFDLGSDDDDDDDDEEDDDSIRPNLNSVSNSASSSIGSTEEEDDEEDDDDVLGFGALFDIIAGDDETSTKKPKVTSTPPLLQFTIPIITKPTTTAPATLLDQELSNNPNDALILETFDENQNKDDEQNLNSIEEESNTENIENFTKDFDTLTDLTTNVTSIDNHEDVTKITNKLVNSEKPVVVGNKIKKINNINKNKKPSITATSINAINDDSKKKPLKKPNKNEHEEEDLLDDDDDDLDDLDDEEDDDLEEEEEDDDKHEDEEDEEEDEKTEDLDVLDDDDDEEEDAVITALVQDDKPKGKKNKITTNQQQQQSSHPEEEEEEEEEDYSIGITDFLGRKKQNGRQSRIMRL